MPLAERPIAAVEAEAIFWESARTKSFADEVERADYRELWFGRYLEHAPGEFFLALGPEGEVTGYLAGSLISDAPPLPGPDYYALLPRDLIAQYPAHLHVNVRADSRGAGIGAELVRAFGGHCRAHGIAGLHAVTVENSRSAAFFRRCGLIPLATVTWYDRKLAFQACSA